MDNWYDEWRKRIASGDTTPLPNDEPAWQTWADQINAPPATNGHDPIVCGLDYKTDCQACRASADKVAREMEGKSGGQKRP